MKYGLEKMHTENLDLIKELLDLIQEKQQILEKIDAKTVEILNKGAH